MELDQFKSSEILRSLAKESGLRLDQLTSIVRTAPLRYKIFKVPKKTGGEREMAQPAKEVKWIQRILVQKLRHALPVHHAAKAYEVGSSIASNARAHADGEFILKMDFSNFFPSIGREDLSNHLATHLPDLTQADIEVICRSCLWSKARSPHLKLCIGAPSSPFLSNTMMFDFDCLVFDQTSEIGVTYTRYADDLTFSTREPGVLRGVEDLVRESLSKISYPKLLINNEKTVHASRTMRRVVTGVVITPSGSLSAGRERKRLIRAMSHKDSLGLLSDKQIEKLDGLISFVDSLEPGFSEKAARWRERHSP